MKSQAKRFFWNALLLTVSSLLMRTVGVWFQVTLSNRIGAEAMGLYSLMGGVYGFALTLATSGLHLGVTRTVVEAIGKQKSEQIPSIMRKASLLAFLLGCFASALLTGLAKPIGFAWLKDGRTVRSLRLFAVSLPFIALSSTWGGYFTAVRRTYKNAAVQVFEQVIKIGGTMGLLSLLVRTDVEGICCILALGGALAEIASFLLELFLYLRDRRKHFLTDVRGDAVGKKLLGVTVPIALTAYVRSALVTLQHILIPEGLRNSGVSHDAALIAYGSIHSMALPVILYPAALISSFSGLLVPEVAESCVQNGHRRVCYIISRVWSLSMIFSVGVAGIMICFSGEIGEALYPGTQTGYYIRWLAPLIPIMYVDTATDAILKGMGAQIYSMNINITDALLSVVLVWLLVPRLGILGYLISIYFSELFNTVLSIAHLLNISKTRVQLFKWVYKPLISIVGATTLTRIWLAGIPHPSVSPPVRITLHCATVFLLYLLLLFLLRGIDREDTKWILGLFSRRREK